MAGPRSRPRRGHQHVGQVLADVPDAGAVSRVDDPELRQAFDGLVLPPIDLGLHLPKVSVDDALDLDRHRTPRGFVPQVVRALPTAGIPGLHLDAERRSDELRRVGGEHVLIAMSHAQAG